jgi:hypothetical protein
VKRVTKKDCEGNNKRKREKKSKSGFIKTMNKVSTKAREKKRKENL